MQQGRYIFGKIRYSSWIINIFFLWYWWHCYSLFFRPSYHKHTPFTDFMCVRLFFAPAITSAAHFFHHDGLPRCCLGGGRRGSLGGIRLGSLEIGEPGSWDLSIAITTQRRLVCFGRNHYGQCTHARKKILFAHGNRSTSLQLNFNFLCISVIANTIVLHVSHECLQFNASHDPEPELQRDGFNYPIDTNCVFFISDHVFRKQVFTLVQQHCKCTLSFRSSACYLCCPFSRCRSRPHLIGLSGGSFGLRYTGTWSILEFLLRLGHGGHHVFITFTIWGVVVRGCKCCWQWDASMCRGLCLNGTAAMACTFVGTTIRLSMQLGTLPSVCPGGLDEKSLFIAKFGVPLSKCSQTVRC